MKIGIKQYLNGNHSWKYVGSNIAKQLMKYHEVDCVSTNGTDKIEPYILPRLKEDLTGPYDAQISYTSFTNFQNYLRYSKNNRFGIWAYETSVLPPGMAKYTNFCKDIFVNNGVKEEKVIVIPHGYPEEFTDRSETFKLKGNSFKILVNIAQPHIRKNIPNLLEAYGRSFTNKDNVSLVLKVNAKKPDSNFEINFQEEYSLFKKRYPKAADVIIIDSYIDYISDIYRAVDAVFSMTYAEGFGLPALEGLVAEKLVIFPRATGQLDFLNDNNSFLIETNKARASKKMQYWIPSSYATIDDPIIDSAVEQLHKAHKMFINNKLEFKEEFNKIKEQYTWEKVVNQITTYIK